MKDKILKFINDYYDKSIELKAKFKITEKKTWYPVTVLAELNVQLGHLSYLLSNYKEFGEKNRKIDNYGDELSDVLLQLFALCWKLKLDIRTYDSLYDIDSNISPGEALLIFVNIYGQVSEMVMELAGYRHYKIRYGYSKQNKFLLDKISQLINLIFIIADKLEIDLSVEYSLMLKDASKFLENYEKSFVNNFFPIVDVHATWLVLNPIQGCPKKCKYCFLAERNLNRVKPNILVSPEEAVRLLLKNRFYNSSIPLCLISQSDAFSTNENTEYVKQLVENLMEKKIKNPIIFITKCHIPIDFIEFIDKYEKQGHKFLFFLSYSGLDYTVELGVDKKIIEENFVNLSKYNKTIVHYWRPFIKENSTKEVIESVYNYVKKYCKASVAIGLKTTNNIIDNIGWEKLEENREEALKADNVWNEFAYDYIWNELKKRDDYPIFQTTSCALGYALGKADRKFFYNTDICTKCNKCTKEQRARCQLKYESYKTPSKKDVLKVLKKIDRVIPINQIEIRDRLIVLKNIELNFNEISYLTDSLETRVITKKNEKDYYWNTSINNASILKL